MKGLFMGSTAAYFAGIFIGSVFTFAGTALWHALEKAEEERLQREATKRRYRLEQRMNARENSHRTNRHD